ncbi:MAG: exopolysaccharide transport family protein [Rhizomicrobium sp.]
MLFQGVNPQSNLPARPPGASYELADILAALRARLGLIVRVAAAVIAVAVVAVLLLPTRFSSSAVVMIDPRKNTIADLSAVLSALPTDPASLQNQIQILQSRDLAAEVIAKLKLYDDPEFNPFLQQSVGSALFASLNPKRWFAPSDAPPDKGAQRDAIIDAFLTHLSTEALGLSTTITVTFSSRDADKAALIADTVAQTYVDDQLGTKLNASDATSAWLTQRIRYLAAQVQTQEAAALTYRATHNLDSSAGGTSLIEQQLGGINGQIVQARADLSAKSAVYGQAQNLVKTGNPANISQIIASPLIIQLRTQQADLLRSQGSLAITYGPKHPRRIAVDNQLKDLDLKINEEATRIVSGLANDVAVARAQLGSLEGSLHATQHQASGQDMTAVKLQALEAEASSTRKLYESYLARLNTIQDQEGLQYPDSRVISRAAVPSAPSSPPRMLIVLASIPAGLLLGCLVALLSVRFAAARPLPQTARPVPASTKPQPRPVAPQPAAPQPASALRTPPILADVPGALATGAADHVIDWPAAPFSRAVTALLAKVAPSKRPDKGRVVTVTTSEAGDAGTTVALALARAAAHAGLRTILVDGHVAQPQVVRLTGVIAQTGLMEVLRGAAPLDRALVRDPRSSALLLGTTTPPRDAKAALAATRTAELFAHLRGMSDLVIVAAPPVLTAGETPYLARLSDAVVMVARPDEGPGPQLDNALAALSQWRSPPVGMVLVR